MVTLLTALVIPEHKLATGADLIHGLLQVHIRLIPDHPGTVAPCPLAIHLGQQLGHGIRRGGSLLQLLGPHTHHLQRLRVGAAQNRNIIQILNHIGVARTLSDLRHPLKQHLIMAIGIAHSAQHLITQPIGRRRILIRLHPLVQVLCLLNVVFDRKIRLFDAIRADGLNGRQLGSVIRATYYVSPFGLWI